MTAIVPTKGRIVWYVISASDAETINKRRKDADQHMAVHKSNSNGVMVHVGNAVREGAIYPAMVVETFGDQPDSYVNLKVELDGSDNYWATSRKVGEGPGTYHWMPYQKGQAAKAEALEKQAGHVAGTVAAAIALCAALLWGQPVRAADVNKPIALPTITPLPIPSGFYVDVEGMGSVFRPGGGIDTLAPAGVGVSGGGGYDFINNGLIFGVYGSVGWVNVRGTATCAQGLIDCSTGNTWEGEVGGRLGFSFANATSWLGNNATFQNLNGKLAAPLQPVPVLSQAVVYLKGGVVFQGLQAAVGTASNRRVDIGYRVGAGVEVPVIDRLKWRTEFTVTKFNDAICGGCMLTSGRPLEYTGKAGPVLTF